MGGTWYTGYPSILVCFQTVVHIIFCNWYYCALGNYIEEMIKPILFPDLAPNASYGVGQKEIGKAQVLYEMSKVLQNYRAEKEKHHEYAVSWHKPLHYSKEPLIEVMSSGEKAKSVKNSQSTTFDNSSKIRL